MCFSLLNGVKIRITHYVSPINLHSSINVTGMARCLNASPNLLSRWTYFLKHRCSGKQRYIDVQW